MISQERVLELYDRANPVANVEDIQTDLAAASYLANLEYRSSEMTQLDTKPEEIKPSDRRLIPILMFAIAALVVGVAIVLATGSVEEQPPATDPPVTIVTEVLLDPQVEEALAVATDFTEARASFDIAGMSNNAIEGHINGFVAGSLQLMPAEFEWLQAIGWTTEVLDCQVANPDIDNTQIECQVSHSNAISESLGEGPFVGTYPLRVMYDGEEKLGVPIVGTTVTEAFFGEFPTAEFVNGTWRPFLTWLEQNHPGDVEAMLGAEIGPTEVDRLLHPGLRQPKLLPESIDLWRQYAAEFVAEQG